MRTMRSLLVEEELNGMHAAINNCQVQFLLLKNKLDSCTSLGISSNLFFQGPGKHLEIFLF